VGTWVAVRRDRVSQSYKWGFSTPPGWPGDVPRRLSPQPLTQWLRSDDRSL